MGKTIGNATELLAWVFMFMLALFEEQRRWWLCRRRKQFSHFANRQTICWISPSDCLSIELFRSRYFQFWKKCLGGTKEKYRQRTLCTYWISIGYANKCYSIVFRKFYQTIESFIVWNSRFVGKLYSWWILCKVQYMNLTKPLYICVKHGCTLN